MIPLSNGRSPRVDQFYATLRAIKSHQFNQDSLLRSEQDRSIEHIRSLGKEILDNQPNRRKSANKQLLIGLNKSSQTLVKPINLYDKYNQKVQKKKVKQIINIKQTKLKQQSNKTPLQNLKKNTKYLETRSKIEIKKTVNGLNYAKKADQQAQKLKQQKMQTQKRQRQMKQKQQYYDRNPRFNKNYPQYRFTQLYRRAQQINQRKKQKIIKVKTQQLEKQMQRVSFKPKIISHKTSNLQMDYQKRNSISNLQKLSREKDVIKQTALSHTFTPQTNYYKQADSKISKIWKQQRKSNKDKDESQLMSNTLKVVRVQSEYENEYKEYKSQRTANSTMQINLKNMNQLSFIFQ